MTNTGPLPCFFHHQAIFFCLELGHGVCVNVHIVRQAEVMQLRLGVGLPTW